MFESVLRGGPQAADWFETSLRTLRELSRRGSLTGAMRSQLAVDVLLDVWSRTSVPGTAADVTMRLDDALAVTDLVEHFLRPLQLTPPKAKLVHATANGPSMLVGLTAKWAAGTPVLLSEHGVYLRERLLAVRRDGYPRTVRTVLVRFFHRLCELGYRSADAVLPVSDFNGRWAVRGGAPADRVRTLHNGVDPRRAAPAGGGARASRRWSSPAGSTRSRTSARWSARSRWSAGRCRTARLRLFGGVPTGNEAYAAEMRRAGRGPRRWRRRHLRRAGVPGVAGVRGRARRRAVQPVRGLAVDRHRSRHVRAPHRGHRRRRDARGGRSRRVGRAARDPAAFAAACVSLLTEHPRRRALAATGRRYALAHFTLDRFLGEVRQLYAEFVARRVRDERDRPLAGRGRGGRRAPPAEPLAPERVVLAHAVASSAEPLEAAVVLESAGVNDRVARDAFAAGDVFALVERAMAEAGADRPFSEPDPRRRRPTERCRGAPPGSSCAVSSTRSPRSSRWRCCPRWTRSSRRSCSAAWC